MLFVFDTRGSGVLLDCRRFEIDLLRKTDDAVC